MRITRHQMFLEMARVASKRSTCHRLNVGAILVSDDRVLSQGYNGPPSKQPHCKGNACELTEVGACMRAVHAEENAIKRAIHWCPHGHKTTIYVTHSPCMHCSRLLVDNKISTVIYETAYRDTKPLEFLIESNVEVFRLSPSGYLINHKTNEIVTI